MLGLPKLADIEGLVQILQQNPFGSLVLVLLVLSVGLIIWGAKR